MDYAFKAKQIGPIIYGLSIGDKLKLTGSATVEATAEIENAENGIATWKAVSFNSAGESYITAQNAAVRVTATTDCTLTVTEGTERELMEYRIGSDVTSPGKSVSAVVDPVTGGIDSYAAGVWLGRTYFAGATEQSIRAAISAAYASGGGVVRFPVLDITLQQPLPVLSGVRCIGIAPRLSFQNITDDGGVGVVPGTGTVLRCAGSFPAFAANVGDLAQKMPDADFAAACINNAEVSGFAIIGASYGVKVGGKYNGGPIYSIISDIFTKDCGWGVWIENMIQSEMRNIVTISSTIGGQMYRVSEGGCGNGKWSRLLNAAKYLGGYTRGICFHGIDTAQPFGMINADYVQSNRFQNTPTVTQAATMVSGTTSVAVADGSAFPVDMPVRVSASANGYSAGRIYFVTSSTGNNITLSETVSGPAISASGSAALNVIHDGYAPLEVVSYTSAGMTGASFRGVDVESGGTSGIILQGVNGSFEAIGTTDDMAVTVAFRKCGPLIAKLSGSTHSIDCDAASCTYLQVFGRVKSATGTLPMGIYSGSSEQSLALRLFSGSPKHSLLGQYKNGLQLLFGGAVRYVSPVLILSGYSLTFTDSTNSYQYAGESAGAVTIPTITDDHIGYPLSIINPTAYALTVNFAAGQLANAKPGVSSITIGAYQSANLLAAKTGSTFFWAIQSGTIAI